MVTIRGCKFTATVGKIIKFAGLMHIVLRRIKSKDWYIENDDKEKIERERERESEKIK